MNEEPKSIWKKPLKGPRGFLLSVILVAAALFLILVSVGYASRFVQPTGDLILFSAFIAVGGSLVVILAVAFLRWIFNWRNFKRFLFGCACVATLIALFYAEENWRGKYDLDKFQRDWEAKGETFGWQSIVPQPVPDGQNFAMSPVWIAREKYTFLNTPKRAEAWYGDRIYSEDVSNFLRLMPLAVGAVVGTNWLQWSLPQVPEVSETWPAGRMTDLTPWQSYYRNLQQKHPAADIAIPPQPQSPAADVLLALSKYDPVIEQLQKDSQLPYSRFPVQYDTKPPAEILLPQLAGLKEAAQVLQLRALAELQTGQTNKAFDDVKLSLRLVDAVHTEPFAISQLVRIAILNMALQPIWEGLAHHQWSDAQLVELDSELARFDFLSDYEAAIRGERSLVSTTIEDLSRQPVELFVLASGDYTPYPPNPPFIVRAMGELIPQGWVYQNELRINRYYTEHYLPAVDVSQRRVFPAPARDEESYQAETRHLSPYNFIEMGILAKFGTFMQRCAHAQNSVDLARVAIALERYRLANGKFPDSLDALAPQFMQQVPHDIINGDPLHYRLDPNGQFVLYSVGWNQTDDGGVVVSNKNTKNETADDIDDIDLDQGDWVWRYPKK